MHVHRMRASSAPPKEAPSWPVWGPELPRGGAGPTRPPWLETRGFPELQVCLTQVRLPSAKFSNRGQPGGPPRPGERILQMNSNQTGPIEAIEQAFAGLEKSIRSIRKPEPVQIESVKELLATGVSHRQICQMYSCRTPHGLVGPFVTENEGVDINLIELESQNAGSVLGPNWRHPQFVMACEEYRATRAAIRARVQQLVKSFDQILGDLSEESPAVSPFSTSPAPPADLGTGTAGDQPELSDSAASQLAELVS